MKSFPRKRTSYLRKSSQCKSCQGKKFSKEKHPKEKLNNKKLPKENMKCFQWDIYLFLIFKSLLCSFKNILVKMKWNSICCFPWWLMKLSLVQPEVYNNFSRDFFAWAAKKSFLKNCYRLQVELNIVSSIIKENSK